MSQPPAQPVPAAAVPYYSYAPAAPFYMPMAAAPPPPPPQGVPAAAAAPPPVMLPAPAGGAYYYCPPGATPYLYYYPVPVAAAPAQVAATAPADATATTATTTAATTPPAAPASHADPTVPAAAPPAPAAPAPAEAETEGGSAGAEKPAEGDEPAAPGGGGRRRRRRGGGGGRGESAGGEGGKQQTPQCYKTTYCRGYKEYRERIAAEDAALPPGTAPPERPPYVCPYGPRCLFAHGPEDKRTYSQNVREGILSEEALTAYLNRLERNETITRNLEFLKKSGGSSVGTASVPGSAAVSASVSGVYDPLPATPGRTVVQVGVKLPPPPRRRPKVQVGLGPAAPTAPAAPAPASTAPAPTAAAPTTAAPQPQPQPQPQPPIGTSAAMLPGDDSDDSQSIDLRSDLDDDDDAPAAPLQSASGVAFGAPGADYSRSAEFFGGAELSAGSFPPRAGAAVVEASPWKLGRAGAGSAADNFLSGAYTNSDVGDPNSGKLTLASGGISVGGDPGDGKDAPRAHGGSSGNFPGAMGSADGSPTAQGGTGVFDPESFLQLQGSNSVCAFPPPSPDPATL